MEYGTYYDNNGKRRSSRLNKNPSSIQLPKQPSPVASTISPSKQPSSVAAAKSTFKQPSSVAAAKSTFKQPSPVAAAKSTFKQPSPVASTISPSKQPSPVASTISPSKQPSPVASTISPILKNNVNISTKLSVSHPSDILSYRLKILEYLKTLKDIKFYLNIKKLLAKIENKATGIVCLSNNNDIFIDNKNIKNFKFAIKIAVNKVNDSVKEIYILEKMLHFITQGYHNLPIIYLSFMKIKPQFIIDNINKTTIKSDDLKNIENFFKNKNYNIYINELATGDLKKFLKSYDEPNSEITEQMLINSILQILMCIATLHSIGISHNDTHYGNFLFHKIIPGGYIKYTIKNETFYVENLGYLWVIWDFGISTQLSSKYDYFNDYEMLSLFIRKLEPTYNMRFIALNKKQEYVRRLHGNWDIKHKQIPDIIQNVIDIIYKLSIQKNTKILPNIPVDIGDKMLVSKDPVIKKQVVKASFKVFRPMTKNGEDILEDMFLNQYIIPLFSSIIKKDDASSTDILFEINLNLDEIKRENKEINGKIRTDIKKSIEINEGVKIFLPEKF